MKKDIISSFEELLKEEDLNKVLSEAGTLQNQYNEFYQKEEELLREQHDKVWGKEVKFKNTPDNHDIRFRELVKIVNEKKKQYSEIKKEEEKQNLEIKLKIVEELKHLNENDLTIGKSFQQFYELQDKWQKTGHVPEKHYKILQQDYSYQRELFFYNIAIYKELQENDLKKNLELKNAVIEKLEKLMDDNSISHVENLVKMYQTEWDEIGPTFQEEWKVLRNRYWDVVRNIYDKIHASYEQIRERFRLNQEEKEKLINAVKELNKIEISSHKDWKTHTDEIINIQNEWKKIGYASKDSDDTLWKQFKTVCNEFFEAKKQFYNKQKEIQKEHKDLKLQIIEEAGKIKDSEDWKGATSKFIELQKQWKTVGFTNHKLERKLWESFKKNCDHFFNAKRTFFENIEETQKTNLKHKQEILIELKEFKASEDKEKTVEEIKSFMERWNSYDPVPRKDHNKLSQDFHKLMDAKFESMNVKHGDRVKLRYENKLQKFQNSADSDRLIQNERKQIRYKIQSLSQDLISFEENLGFFKNSNHEHPLKQEVQIKIDRTKKQIADLKQKMDLLPKKVNS